MPSVARLAGRQAIAKSLHLHPPPHGRAPLLAPFTPMESLVASMIGYGHNYSDIAERLRIARETAAHHAKRAAKKIPGDLPQQMKIVFWFRGAPIELLTARWESPISGDVLGEV